MRSLCVLAIAAAGAAADVAPAQPAFPFGVGAPSLMGTPGFYPPSMASQLALVNLRDAVMGKMQWNNWPGGKPWVQPTADASDAERKQKAAPAPKAMAPPKLMMPAWPMTPPRPHGAIGFI